MNHDSPTMPANDNLGFVGAGKMAQALASGVVASDLKSSKVCFLDPADEAADHFCMHAPDAQRCHSLQALASQCRVIILAIKPQIMPQVLPELAAQVTEHHLVISIAAGIPIHQLETHLGTHRVVRVMPNTPCLIAQGMSAIAHDPAVGAHDLECALTILRSVGEVALVNESQMDVVTGLSGSGPAYVFSFIEALVESGVSQGLSADLAQQLTLKTIKGAVALVEATGRSPHLLREQVTSPGGTTLAGLTALENGGFAKAVKNAVAAATARSRELSM